MVSAGGIGKCAVRTSRTSVVAAESRMRTDQIKDSVKVFNGGAENLEADDKAESRVPEQMRSSPGARSAVKRKTCKSESNSVVQIVGERSPSQLQKRKSCVAVSVANGNCRSPVQSQRKKSLKSGSDDCDQRSAIVISSPRSDLKSSKAKESLEADGSDRSVGDADQRHSAELKNPGEEIGGRDGEIEKGLAQSETEKTRSDEENEDEQEEDDVIDDDESVDRIWDGNVNGYPSGEDEEEEVEERIEEEMEVEKSISCDEEIVDEKNISCDEKTVVEENISDDDVVVVEENISDSDEKVMNATQVTYSIPNSNSEINSKPKFSSSKPTIAAARSSSSKQFSPVKKQSPRFSRPIHSSPIRGSDPNQRVPETHSKLQSLVDLVMWKYVPRSTLVFGVGTFLIISSSYTKDINISFISVVSYLGLIYLGISFLYKSFRCRNGMNGSDMSYSHGMVVIGEEDAIWLSRLILPSLNEFLLKLKALFTGDPAVTMKLAAVLFALARCGSSFTVWKVVKLGFFAAFILPKFCSSYSAQISGYGKFWILRFKDAWSSCSHKKVVGFAMFTIVWNLSSVIARIWAAFMLFVAVRYYQQSTIKGETWDNVEAETGGTSNEDHVLRRRPQVIRKSRQGRPSTTPIPSTPVDLKEAKKGS